MARTDKPTTNSSQSLKQNSKSSPTMNTNKRKREVVENYHQLRTIDSIPANTDFQAVASLSYQSTPHKVVPRPSLIETLNEHRTTLEAAPNTNEEMTILQSTEYQQLMNWFQKDCRFAPADAQAIALVLILQHKVTNLETLYLLLIRDRNFFLNILPIGYLMTLEQQLCQMFFKKLEELNSSEVYGLLRNIGISRNTVEILVSTYELNGFILATMPQLEKELLGFNLNPLVAKSIAIKVHEWKICGVPIKLLTSKERMDEKLAPIEKPPFPPDTPDNENEIQLANTSAITEAMEIEPEKPLENATDTSFEIALEECFKRDGILNSYSEECEMKMNELFDFEIMSNFEEEFNFDEKTALIEEGIANSFIGSAPATQLECSSSDATDVVDEQETPQKLKLATRKGKRSRTHQSVKERAIQLKAHANDLSHTEQDNITRNFSFLQMRIAGLREPAISYLEKMIAKNKKSVLEEMIKHRIFEILVGLVIEPDTDENTRKQCFQIINRCIRLAEKEQLSQFLHLPDALVLLNTSVKKLNGPIIHQSLIFLQLLIERRVPFLYSALQIFMKILNKGKEKIVRCRFVKNLAKILELALRYLPLDLETLIAALPIIYFLFHSKDENIQFLLLQCCTMIVEEDKEYLTEYFLFHFPLDMISKFFGSRFQFLQKETLTICEIIACGKVEYVKKLLMEMKTLVPYLKNVISNEEGDKEYQELQSLSQDIIGSICAGDSSDLQIMIDYDVFPVLMKKLLLYTNGAGTETSPFNSTCHEQSNDHELKSPVKKTKGKVKGQVQELTAVQCAFAISYSLYGSTDEQIDYFISIGLINAIDRILKSLSHNKDIMEELIPGILRLLESVKDRPKIQDLAVLLTQQHSERILQLKNLFSEKSKKNEIEDIIKILILESCT